MRLTIIPSDAFCSVDGVGYNGVDVSTVAVNVHAVQWDGVSGWIEFRESDGVKPANETIDTIDQFQPVIDSWSLIDYEHKHPTPPAPVPPTAEENKATAEGKLIATDWSQLPDVNITNRDEFVAYRSIIREYVLNPVAGFIDWPVEPQPVWI